MQPTPPLSLHPPKKFFHQESQAAFAPHRVVAKRDSRYDCGLPYWQAVSHFLVVMDLVGPETSVTLCRTYRRMGQSTPVIDRLEQKKGHKMFILWAVPVEWPHRPSADLPRRS
jgi:hypothetical protein